MDADGALFVPQTDEDFLRWLKENPGGFVLSSDKPSYNRVHRATCSELTKREHWVRPHVVKVCSGSVEELAAWANRHPNRVRSGVTACKVCEPPPPLGFAQPPRRAWLFQANPDTFDIDGYLAGGRERITWTIRQEHLADHMQVGDEVYIWRAIGSGGDREVSGVVASGHLVEQPGVYEEEEEARPFWRSTDGLGPTLRVRIRVDRVANKKELLKRDWMVDDPVLADLGVLKVRNQTNYPVDPAQAVRLRLLWANTGRDWDRKDCIAGLWAYDQTYGGPISRARGSIVSNTALLIGRAVSGVYNKVLNFRSIDPRDEREGLSGAGEMDRQVWQEFYDEGAQELRSDRLDDEFRKAWHAVQDEAPIPGRPVYAEYGEAPNDDPEALRSFSRALRRGQPAFRRNLLVAYEGKCCVSGWGPEPVLEAAHIEEHSKSGLNSLANGLLLRSDLHALFDEGLLRIDPDRLVVVLAPSLEGTPYWELQGQVLRPPVKGDGPSRELLKTRWRAGNSQRTDAQRAPE